MQAQGQQLLIPGGPNIQESSTESSEDLKDAKLRAETGDTEVGSKKLLREPSKLTSKRKFIIGLIIVIVIASSWVGSTQTAKSSYTEGFSAPYFVSWFSTAWMIIVFPLTAPLYFITGKAKFSQTGVKELFR